MRSLKSAPEGGVHFQGSIIDPAFVSSIITGGAFSDPKNGYLVADIVGVLVQRLARHLHGLSCFRSHAVGCAHVLLKLLQLQYASVLMGLLSSCPCQRSYMRFLTMVLDGTKIGLFECCCMQ